MPNAKIQRKPKCLNAKITSFSHLDFELCPLALFRVLSLIWHLSFAICHCPEKKQNVKNPKDN
jgi:hypothetical protein